ncbi:MAG: arginine--tRNA ligase [Patescibacteria group bacterium]|nr:arginine--tRNA ligase [Patescibacteria group bacterium]
MFNEAENFSQVELRVRSEITEFVKNNLPADAEGDSIIIDYPARGINGDYSVPCFLLGKKLRKNPAETATYFEKNFKPTELVKKVVATGPYLNFFVNQENFARLTLTEIYKQKEKYGRSKVGKNQRVMVEYFSPNTNKPLTVGHLRNICLGDSLSSMMKFSGYKVIRSTLYNNRGIAIAKTILGYIKWGKNKTPKSAKLKPDHFVGSFYVHLTQEAKTDKTLDVAAQKILQDWENGSPKINGIWEKLMVWVLEGFKQTLTKLGIAPFDEEYYESEFYQSGKDIVEQGIKQGVFIKNNEGVILAPLERFGIPDKIVLRPDSTSLYVTQDLYLAYMKAKHNLSQSIYVVGSEQDLYFRQLFKILELLDFKNISNYHHLSYGMIRLPSGKIKSREGLIKGTGADDLIGMLEKLAREEIKHRYQDLSDKELEQRSEQISVGAIKFYILAVSPGTTMVFNPSESVAFTGRTGPYLQYVAARINSIFEKTKLKPTLKVDFSVLASEAEMAVIKSLAKYPGMIISAVAKRDPSLVANYLFDLAKNFSLFYEQQPILSEDKKVTKARLLLIKNVRTVLVSGLRLLGIESPSKM